ncbi:Transcriptional regulator of nonfermentable carbon utilization, partial [Linderina macrospora]
MQQQPSLQVFSQLPDFSQTNTSTNDSATSIPEMHVSQAPPLATSGLIPSSLPLVSTSSAVGFGSVAVNLEYDFLSSMLAYPMFANQPLNPAPSADGSADMTTSVSSTLLSENTAQQAIQTSGASTISIPNALWAPSLQQQQQQQHQQQPVMSIARQQDMQAGNPLDSIVQPQQQNIWDPQRRQSMLSEVQQTLTSTIIKNSPPPPHMHTTASEDGRPLSRPSTSGPAVYGLNPVYPQSPAEVYSSVTEPYKYFNGFHYFFRHIQGRMDKRDIMRVSSAIAHFRPSLVALLRNLTRDDLIFMEKSFQRALMEYEKLIGFT